ncbi:hypothetical protein [Egbenema bharatensis]|uniref:hypothetical protein n=1 Tax=Egbenema bharatensis TaxID=3463334 RepID=UPI003A8C13E3
MKYDYIQPSWRDRYSANRYFLPIAILTIAVFAGGIPQIVVQINAACIQSGS